MIFQDLTGQRFNKLVVQSYVGKVKSGQSKWQCVCDCGNTHVAIGSHLKTGNVKSCGCLLLSENRSNSARRHGGTATPEYNSYHSAKKRCNPKHAHISNYKDWSGRGIKFRFTSFKEFLEEVGPRPEPKFEYSLNRIDNDGHYEKGNVCWSTKGDQARNRRCSNCDYFKRRIRELEYQLQHKR